jgi:hypothetical protein
MADSEVHGDVEGTDRGVAAGRDVAGGVHTGSEIRIVNNNYFGGGQGAGATATAPGQAAAANRSDEPTSLPQLIEVQRPLVETLDSNLRRLRWYVEGSLSASDMMNECDIARRWLDRRLSAMGTSPEEHRIDRDDWEEIESHVERLGELIEQVGAVPELRDAVATLAEGVRTPFLQVSMAGIRDGAAQLEILQANAQAMLDTLGVGRSALSTCRRLAREILDDVKDDVVRILELADITGRLSEHARTRSESGSRVPTPGDPADAMQQRPLAPVSHSNPTT